MNDEYIWDKTGSDPEIEGLEKALAVFRHREVNPPFPVLMNAKRKTRFASWRMPMAFAAGITVAALLAALLFQIALTKEPAVVMVVLPEPETPSAPASPAIENNTAPLPSVHPAAQFAELRRAKTGHIARVKDRRPEAKVQKPYTLAALTNEERFAYRQLMLALSITGSKLKIVQDTIDGNVPPEKTTGNDQR